LAARFGVSPARIYQIECRGRRRRRQALVKRFNACVAMLRWMRVRGISLEEAADGDAT
jgi:hypothetical protein